MYNEDNGGINEDPNATDLQGSMMGERLQQRINEALGIIDNTLAYGYRKYGLGKSGDGAIENYRDNNEMGSWRRPIDGGEYPEPSEDGVTPARPRQRAGLMPTIPGTQSESGIPPRRPTQPGQQASRMPSVPGSQSDSGIAPQQPAPGPLPPTSNPFGKRAETGEPDEPEQTQDAPGGIDTEEELA